MALLGIGRYLITPKSQTASGVTQLFRSKNVQCTFKYHSQCFENEGACQEQHIYCEAWGLTSSHKKTKKELISFLKSGILRQLINSHVKTKNKTISTSFGSPFVRSQEN